MGHIGSILRDEGSRGGSKIRKNSVTSICEPPLVAVPKF